MTKQLTLGTGKIVPQKNGSFLLVYMNHGSFTVGERGYSKEEYAREFCRERDIKVLN